MRHAVVMKDPPLKSLAARVLLERRLRRQEIVDYLTFKKAFLNVVREVEGTLRCHYCGLTGLTESVGDNPTKAELRRMATVDHVVPRSRGGSERDPENLVVACWSCNQRKADSAAYGRDKPGRAGDGIDAGA